MIKGFEHLFTLGVLGETLSRNAYRSDAFAVGGDQGMADMAAKRALEAVREIEDRAAAVRSARDVGTAQDAFAAVLAGKVERIANPGQWVVYRDGGKVICEVQSDEA